MDRPIDTGLGDPRDRKAIEAARRYFVDDQSTPEIAREFGVSRSTVSRWITHAKERGWVRIQVVDPIEHAGVPERRLLERFELASVTAVPVEGRSNALDQVTRRAEAELSFLVNDGDTVGIAWGTTMSSLAMHLSPLVGSHAVVVQLNGAGSLADVGGSHAEDILSKFVAAWGATPVVFPVPAFFDHASTRDALWRERSIDRVRSLQRSCDVAVFSIGSSAAEVPSRVYEAGYISDEDSGQLESDGVVGDIATNFFKGDGTHEGIGLNRRASGIPLDDLRSVRTRFCVVSGIGKAHALAGALNGGFITHLVADAPLLTAVEELTRNERTQM